MIPRLFPYPGRYEQGKCCGGLCPIPSTAPHPEAVEMGAEGRFNFRDAFYESQKTVGCLAYQRDELLAQIDALKATMAMNAEEQLAAANNEIERLRGVVKAMQDVRREDQKMREVHPKNEIALYDGVIQGRDTLLAQMAEALEAQEKVFTHPKREYYGGDYDICCNVANTLRQAALDAYRKLIGEG